MTQKELYELLKSNPENTPVYFEQNTIEKTSDFILWEIVDENATYADDAVYNYATNFQFSIYCDDIDKMNRLKKWMRETLNVVLDSVNKEDLYYVAVFKKQIRIDEW